MKYDWQEELDPISLHTWALDASNSWSGDDAVETEGSFPQGELAFACP